jgi:N-acetyl-anhydromuramyl-L-alanine amidase AmpD
VAKRKRTDRIVFHHSAGARATVEEIRQWHQARGWDDIGYHFVIPPEGPFEVGRDIHLVGIHAPGRNSSSIGVCLVGHFGKTEPTASQINEALRLYHQVCRAYSKRLTIEFHHEECPGAKLDREAFTKTLYELGGF